MKMSRYGLLIGVVMAIASTTFAFERSHPATDFYDGWRLAVQAWSLKEFSFDEALDKAAELGLNWIEAYPGQRLSSEQPDLKFDHHLAAAERDKVKAKLNALGIGIISYGVVGLPSDEAECRKVFEFARDFGIDCVNAEPREQDLDMIEALCREYRVKLGIHNHPKPSHYWNPDTVLAACDGRSHWIGACADTGHWVRSGLDPVKCLDKLAGRVNSLHFKEIDSLAQPQHDVVWGTAQNRVTSELMALRRQGFQGTFAIEYEYHWDNNLPEIAGCVAYFNRLCRRLSGGAGWQPLLADDLGNADLKPGSWTYEKGTLTRQGEGDIWTQQAYGNFILDLQFQVQEGTNSGVFLRAGDHNWLPWVEVQIQDDYGKAPDCHSVGGLYDVMAPRVNAVRPAGQWNRLTLTADGPFITVVLNGQTVVDVNLNYWTTAHKNPDGSDNKFDIAYKDLPRSGCIGLQDHGHPVAYRHLRIKEL